MNDLAKEQEKFYNALNVTQKAKVEDKVKTMLRESMQTLPESNINYIRWQVAEDTYQILEG